MSIQIQVLSVNVEDKGKYKMAEIAYKNLSDGKTTAKKLMSFNNPNVYSTITSAKSGEIFTVEMSKNEKGYWDWIAATSGSNTAGADTQTTTTSKTGATPSPKSTYETPEERAKKQVYIVRQSSISAAIETIKTDKKTPTVTEVLEVAKQYEAFVLGVSASPVPLAALPTLDTDEDIPV